MLNGPLTTKGARTRAFILWTAGSGDPTRCGRRQRGAEALSPGSRRLPPALSQILHSSAPHCMGPRHPASPAGYLGGSLQVMRPQRTGAGRPSFPARFQPGVLLWSRVPGARPRVLPLTPRVSSGRSENLSEPRRSRLSHADNGPLRRAAVSTTRARVQPPPRDEHTAHPVTVAGMTVACVTIATSHE